MTYVLRCTQKTVPGWVAWGQRHDPPRKIFGDEVSHDCNYHREKATEFATVDDAEAFGRELERVNRTIGLRAEVVPA